MTDIREESGRPPIDAPPHEHRRWFNDKIVELCAAYYQIDQAVDVDEQEAAERRHSKIWEQLTEAYMDGNRAERKTLEFKSNEFHDVVDDQDYIVTIEEYADKDMLDPPAYRLLVFHDDKLVLKIRRLSADSFDIGRMTYRNIVGDGP